MTILLVVLPAVQLIARYSCGSVFGACDLLNGILVMFEFDYVDGLNGM